MSFSRRTMLVKVPEITLAFWVIKILTTAFGESLSDFAANSINPIVAVLIGAVVFVAAIFAQFKARTYVPGIYWFTVAMVAVFGTMVADGIHVGLGVPYTISTIFFAVALAVIFIVWYRVEKTLSIHSITTFRRELFYWLTVVTTFALGTAAGDWTAVTLKLGFLDSGIIFGVLLLVVALAHYAARAIARLEHIRFRNEVIAFWIAYVFTRPLGASFADWFGKPAALGGIGLGDGVVSLILGVLIVIGVLYLMRTREDEPG